MLDNEFERMEAGWLMEEGKRRDSESSDIGGMGDSPSPRRAAGGMAIWDYIKRFHEQSPVFYNFNFSPLDQEEV